MSYKRKVNSYTSSSKWVQDKAVNDVVLNVQAVDWHTWQERYCKQLKHVVGFEKAFVQNILMNVPNLTYADVIPQYHFVDDKGGNRYIDFMIINKSKGYCLPIELDGYSKMVGNGEEYHRFNDFLERQNAIVKLFGLVLRYSNKKMLNEPDSIINEISHTLNLQANNKSTEVIKQQQVTQLMTTYDKQIKELKEQNNTNIESLVSELRQEISSIKKQPFVNHVKTPLPPVTEYSDNSKYWLIFIGLGMVAVAILAYIALNKQQAMPQAAIEEPRVEEPRYEAPTVTYEHEPSSNEVSSVPSPVIAYEKETEAVIPMPEPKVEPKPVVKPEPVKPVKEEQKPVETKSEYTEGSYQEICGNVASYKEFAKGVYLNLDGMYPKHKASITVWNAKEPEVYHLYNERVCASGKIEFYKGKPRVSVQSVNQVSIR